MPTPLLADLFCSKNYKLILTSEVSQLIVVYSKIIYLVIVIFDFKFITIRLRIDLIMLVNYFDKFELS